MQYENIIKSIYAAFNNRDIDGVFTFFHPDVEWPLAWEEGYVSGHDAVRAYWTRQWAEIDPVVNPVAIAGINSDEVSVSVQQVVKDKQSNIIADVMVQHNYIFENSLVRKMIIGSHAITE